MQIFKDIATLKDYLTRAHPTGVSLGFVPTMGALHDGHLSLVRESVRNNDLTLASIYVNPAQFNNPDDLENYPKSIEDDLQMLDNEGCDAVFMPDDTVMYPDEPQIGFELGYLNDIMEGKFRPGHFNGVAVIVSKFLNLIRPDTAYFGQKDLQQFVILNAVARRLFMQVNMVRLPTVREQDGLAMSSRNRRLTPGQRSAAAAFYQALTLAEKNFKMGYAVTEIKQNVGNFFSGHRAARLEYFEIVDSETLLPYDKAQGGTAALCIAGYVGDIRLIDNLIMENN